MESARSGIMLETRRKVSLIAMLALIPMCVPALTDDASATDRPRYRFENVTREAGLRQSEPKRMWGSAWGDFNLDGRPDLFVGRHLFTPMLMANLGGSFEEMAGETELYRRFDRHACAWGEANADGRPDLYCTSGARKGQGEGPNRLYVQTATGFVDMASEHNVQDRYGRGRTVNWLDFDRDGDLDLFVGNKYRESHPNVLFENLGGRFRRAHVGVAREFRTISSSWSDWDRDGDPDLLVLRYDGRSVAYENRRASFHRVKLWHVTNRHWKSGAWGDFNGDGWPDLHAMNERRSVILKNKRGRFHRVHSISLGVGRMSGWLDLENDSDLDLFVVQGARRRSGRLGENRADFLINRGRDGFRKIRGRSFRGPKMGEGDSVSVADYDGDGRADVFVTNGYGDARGYGVLLRNRSRTKNWSQIRLRGGASNPFGMGAKVRVVTSAWSYRREVTDSFNYRAQSDVGVVHVGLKSRIHARVRVVWPSGRADCLHVSHREILTLQEGTSPCRAA